MSSRYYANKVISQLIMIEAAHRILKLKAMDQGATCTFRLKLSSREISVSVRSIPLIF